MRHVDIRAHRGVATYALSMDDDGLDIDEDADLSPLAEAAVALHEIYEALVEAGFGEMEALRVISNVVVEQGISE